jgi:hypothetical protein
MNFMNLEEFLAELGKTKNVFNWTKNGNYIRAKQESSEEITYFCPITAVSWNKEGKFFDTTQVYQAAKTSLGMSSEDTAKIIASSDSWNWSLDLDMPLRINMLKTLGLLK